MTRVAIVGAAETDRLGTIPDMSAMQLHAEAGMNALRDAGLVTSQIDGVACAGESPLDVADYLGIVPRWIDGTDVGGCSPAVLVRHAAAAIAAGLCDTVLVTHGESGRSGIGMTEWHPKRQSHLEQFESPYGPYGAASLFPIGLMRYMRDHSVTIEEVAMVPVVQREWSSRNPRAKMQKLVTVDEVLDSPMIAYPIRLLMCCLVTDGGGALVLRSPDKVALGDHPTEPLVVLGSGEAYESSLVAALSDVTSSGAMRRAAADAFAEARVGPGDLDHLMIYDAFAHVPLYGLEAIGVVGRGEVAPFVAERRTAPGGQLPMNTNGGGLSYTHTGMYGMFAILEAVRQLRGEAAAQVADPQISLVQTVGGMFMSSATLVLGTWDAASSL